MKDHKGNISCHWEIHLHKCWLEGVKLNVRMTQRFSVVVFHRSLVDWQGGNLKVTLAVNLTVPCSWAIDATA